MMWLPCGVLSGMFSDERVIVLALLDGDTVSYFVPASDVDEARGRVRLVDIRDDGRVAWATLPTDTRVIVAVAPASVIAD